MADLPPLDDVDCRLLKVLNEDGGFATGTAGRYAGLQTGRKHSALLYQRFRYLKQHGLVTELDDIKPVAWVRTKLGTEALRQRAERDGQVASPSP